MPVERDTGLSGLPPSVSEEGRAFRNRAERDKQLLAARIPEAVR